MPLHFLARTSFHSSAGSRKQDVAENTLNEIETCPNRHVGPTADGAYSDFMCAVNKTLPGTCVIYAIGHTGSLFCSTPLVCAQELRQNEIIDRLKAFSITPDPGSVIEVKAGQGRRLVISYSADSLLYGGVHDLPVLASNNLFGVCLSQTAPQIHRSVCCTASDFTSSVFTYQYM